MRIFPYWCIRNQIYDPYILYYRFKITVYNNRVMTVKINYPINNTFQLANLSMDTRPVVKTY